jgi:ferredoxin-NADP reductase
MLIGASPSSVLAFVTTVHLAFAVLRAHRSSAYGPFGLITLVSLLLGATPWLLSAPLGLALGLAAQVGWFAACERFLPNSGPSRPVRAVTAPPLPQAPSLVDRARRPREFVSVPVLATIDETPDIRTFRLARPPGFGFSAGQFLTVRVRADGREHVRCYSISSAPEVAGYLEISVKRLGVVSGTLHATLRPGSTVAVRAPAGSFLYPSGEDRAIVLVAGGVGITPLMSMLRHAVAAEPTRPITLFYSVKTQDDIAFHDELRLLARRHSQFRLFMAITQGQAAEGFFPGHLTDTLFRTTVPDIAHAECLVCGPPPMMDAVAGLLLTLGVPRTQVRVEIFEAAIAASAGKVLQGAPEGAAKTGFQARFERSHVTTAVRKGETLLEASEACGAGIPSLCRAGVCGTCRTRVVNGDVDCASDILDDQDRRDGYVLACVSRIGSDCTVDA